MLPVRSSLDAGAGLSVSVDPARVKAALRSMPRDKLANALAETFRCLSDPTRVRIVVALARQELSVTELAAVLGLTGSAVSHQLRLLRGQRLVKYRKQGKVAFYALDDPHISNLIAEGVRHVGAD
jgi:DNA-binding transcriptional ArsR family regulator